MRLLRHIAVALTFLMPLLATASTVVETDEVRAELLAYAPEGVSPGKPAWLGLSLQHRSGWHTYWKNPGDSGLATQVRWRLPEGVHAGEIEWPTPKRMPIGPLANYGYEGTILLPVPLNIDAAFTGASLTINLEAEWLVCKLECIPQSGKFTLNLPVGQAMSAHAAAFSQAQSLVPHGVDGVSAQGEVRGEYLHVTVKGLPFEHGAALQFFSEQPGVIEYAAPVSTTWQGDEATLQVALSSQRSEAPGVMNAVLVASKSPAGIAVQFPVTGWTDQTSATPDAPSSPPRVAVGLWAALALAFGGGLLLNLMPCVFPILSLKVLSFAQHSGDRRALIAGGVAYTVGVVVSFALLAGLLMALRAGGDALGWGFQLQSPWVVLGLAVLFMVIAANLLGAFEFASVLPSRIASMQAKNPVLDHGLTGVLAVAIASPCTAPFMGVALGAALTMPTHEAMAVFLSLGLGMAAPYLLAALWPGIAERMPRPGAWMGRFKALMAFPMLATVIWLVWVLGQQAGIDAVAAALGLLVAIGFGAWAIGLRGMGKAGTLLFKAAAVGVVAVALAWVAPLISVAGMQAPTPAAGADATWQPWSETAVAAARQQGRPIFIDFTAAWCVTCQFNKRTVLSDQAVLDDLALKNTLLLRADWTNRDDAITKELSKLGRNGVPVYALYGPGAVGPVLLPEILTAGIVREAIADWPVAGQPEPTAGMAGS